MKWTTPTGRALALAASLALALTFSWTRFASQTGITSAGLANTNVTPAQTNPSNLTPARGAGNASASIGTGAGGLALGASVPADGLKGTFHKFAADSVPPTSASVAFCTFCHDPHKMAVEDPRVLRDALFGSVQGDGFLCLACHKD